MLTCLLQGTCAALIVTLASLESQTSEQSIGCYVTERSIRMKRRTAASMLIAPLVVTGAVAAIPTASATSSNDTHNYRVTVVNATGGQPFSPPVVATHNKKLDVFLDGRRATPELASIAQAGDGSSAVAAFESQLGMMATDVVDVGQPLTPTGVVDGPFPNTVTFDIAATDGDRLSLATMLICTNDGVTGLDAVKLPRSGSSVLPLQAYDAGVERNTEDSAHIPDACSALGPEMLAGDNNGNDDGPMVATNKRVKRHKGIHGGSSLTSAHNWSKGPVGVVTVTRLS